MRLFQLQANFDEELLVELPQLVGVEAGMPLWGMQRKDQKEVLVLPLVRNKQNKRTTNYNKQDLSK